MSALRTALSILTGLVLAGALISAICGAVGPTFAFGFWSILLLIGLLFERWRYKKISEAPFGAGWSITDERFIDPETGKPVTVYFNAATGERRYVNR